MKSWLPASSLRHLAPFLAAMAITVAAHAQIGVFANFTAATQYRVSSSSSDYQQSWTYGPTAGIYAQIPLPLISIGGDLRGIYVTGDQLRHWSGLIGPRVEIKPPAISFHPYGEFLVGIGGYRDDLYSTNTTTHIDYAIIGGIDKKLIPVIDWRVVEFVYNSYFNNRTPASKQISTGLILRLP